MFFFRSSLRRLSMAAAW